MQILNKLKTIFDNMVTNSFYSFLDGEKYIQIPNLSNNQQVKAGPPTITPLGLGFNFRQGFLKNITISNNLQVIETLLQYCNVNNALVIIKPCFLNKNVWKTEVYLAGMKVFSDQIRFSDDKFYETQLLKWKYSIK